MKQHTSYDIGPYKKAGLTIIPLWQWNAKDAKGRERGKSPADNDWVKRNYKYEDVVARCSAEARNIGVRVPSSWVVVDVDPRNFTPGVDSLIALDKVVGLGLDNAPHTITGSGGHHYWFRKPADVDLVDSLHDFPGVEFKSRGRQVVAAGSTHPSGGRYVWDDFGPDLEDAPQIPPRLLALARRALQDPSKVGLGAGSVTCQELDDLLGHLDPIDFRDHDKWRDLMMACHHATAGEGRTEFVDWCTGDEKYAKDGWIVGRRWDSLHTNRSGGVTERYLFKCVHDVNGVVPRASPEDDFADAELVDGATGEVDDGSTWGSSPIETLKKLNAKHCCVTEGGAFKVFTEEWDRILNRPIFLRSNKYDFMDRYANRSMERGEGAKPIAMGAWWLQQPDRRQYDGVLFDPERNHPGWLNLWKGWSVEPKKGDWSILRQLLKDVLCAGDEDSYQYVMKWSANMVQRPGSPAEVALCFRGNKGTGKGTFGRAISGLAGSHGLHISSPGHLTGRFNSHLQNCVALFADEAFWAGDKAGESTLKQLVTEPTLLYEGKGRDATMGRNLIHIIMASNSDWVVPAGMDKERRFAVFEVTDARVGDKKFFEELHKQMSKGGGTAAMLYDLLTMDIAGWSPRDGVPVTKALIDQKLASMDSFGAWWYERLAEGHIAGSRDENSDWSESPLVIAKARLRASYEEYTRIHKVKYPLPPIEFGHRIRKMAPGVQHFQRTLTEKEIDIPCDVKRRAYFYTFTPLEDCRAQFCAQVGGAIEWSK